MSGVFESACDDLARALEVRHYLILPKGSNFGLYKIHGKGVAKKFVIHWN